jgi:hypothetical protein
VSSCRRPLQSLLPPLLSLLPPSLLSHPQPSRHPRARSLPRANRAAEPPRPRYRTRPGAPRLARRPARPARTAPRRRASLHRAEPRQDATPTVHAAQDRSAAATESTEPFPSPFHLPALWSFKWRLFLCSPIPLTPLMPRRNRHSH